MKKSLQKVFSIALGLGVIATADVPAAVPPELCHDSTSGVTCIYIPIAFPEDDYPPPPPGRPINI